MKMGEFTGPSSRINSTNKYFGLFLTNFLCLFFFWKDKHFVRLQHLVQSLGDEPPGEKSTLVGPHVCRECEPNVVEWRHLTTTLNQSIVHANRQSCVNMRRSILSPCFFQCLLNSYMRTSTSFDYQKIAIEFVTSSMQVHTRWTWIYLYHIPFIHFFVSKIIGIRGLGTFFQEPNQG